MSAFPLLDLPHLGGFGLVGKLPDDLCRLGIGSEEQVSRHGEVERSRAIGNMNAIPPEFEQQGSFEKGGVKQGGDSPSRANTGGVIQARNNPECTIQDASLGQIGQSGRQIALTQISIPKAPSVQQSIGRVT